MAKKLSGIEKDDLKNLMGRHRLTQALELEDKSSNHHLTRGLYYNGAVLLFYQLQHSRRLHSHDLWRGRSKGSVNVISTLKGNSIISQS